MAGQSTRIYKPWTGAFSKNVFGEFIDDLRRCHIGRISKDDGEILENWYKIKDTLRVYTSSAKWVVHFEIRQGTRVVGEGMLSYKIFHQYSEWRRV